MDVEFPIEPDDGAESDGPCTYQVSFWEKLTDPEPPAIALWQEMAYRLRNVNDVREALHWAAENASGRSFTLYLEAPTRDGNTLVHIAGIDPTRASPT